MNLCFEVHKSRFCDEDDTFQAQVTGIFPEH